MAEINESITELDQMTQQNSAARVGSTTWPGSIATGLLSLASVHQPDSQEGEDENHAQNKPETVGRICHGDAAHVHMRIPAIVTSDSGRS